MLTPDAALWQRAKNVFSEALEQPATERDRFVRTHCSDDPALAARVRELIALQGESGLALDRAPAAATEAGALLTGVSGPEKSREGEIVAGRYRLGARIGSGGMGEVYLGFDIQTGGSVAIKAIRPFTPDSRQAEARFLREVEMAQRIRHPNVCRMQGLEEDHGTLYLAMELIEGQTLAACIAARGRLSAEETLPIALGLCDGLAAAHAAGVVHRDLKPANVIVASDGRPVIIDFGLAAGLAHEQSLTAESEVIGTLAYMAPEQLEGPAAVGAPADIYSLGVVLHEMLTGRKPHAARSPLRLAVQKSREVSGTEALRGVPPVWRETIERCLRMNPRERFAKAADVRWALERRRASLRFVLSRPRAFVPLAAALVTAIGWVATERVRANYSPAPAVSDLYRQAEAAMAEAAPVRAVRLLEQAVAGDPDFIAARSLLAASYAEIDQPEQARDAVLEASAAADRRWLLGAGERWALRAARALAMRDHKRAAAEYRSLASGAKAGPSRTFALLAASRALEQSGNRDEALRLAESALSGDPGNPAARVRVAILLSRSGQRQRALAEFERAEAAFQKAGNLEGMSDLLLARFSAPATGSLGDHRDLDRVLELSARTGNRYHNLSAKFRLATVAERDRDYDGAVRIAREAAEQARREGMPIVAAQALGELGYAFVYLKRPEEAEPILREAVEMAERAKATGALAHNRMRLGEALGMSQRSNEALAVMEPAVAWLREHGNRDALPLTLMKWGTILSSTPRFAEAEPVYQESLRLARAAGHSRYESMALDRIASHLTGHDPVQALPYWDQAIEAGRNTRLTRVHMLAARTEIELGHLDRAERLLREGEAEARTYPPGLDRDELHALALSFRARLAYVRGDCSLAEQLMRQARQLTAGSGRDAEYYRLRACSSDRSALRSSAAWLETDSAKAQSSYATCQNRARIAAMHLRLGNLQAAEAFAAGALAEAHEWRFIPRALESALVLRAAEMRLGKGEAARRLEAEIMGFARAMSFDPPEGFGGRRDLLSLWQLNANPR